MMDVLVNNVLKEYGDVKEEIKNLKALNIPQRLFSIYQTKLSYCLKYGKKQKVKIRELQKQTKENQFFYQNVRSVAVKN